MPKSLQPKVLDLGYLIQAMNYVRLNNKFEKSKVQP